MTLNSQQIALIQSAVPTIVAQSEAVASAFYAQLFALDPSLRAMFRGDMTEQGRKLMQMLGVALSNLDKLDTLRPALRALGERHLNYGVSDHPYSVVGTALITTPELLLGEAFTSDTRAAWARLYGHLTHAIKSGL